MIAKPKAANFLAAYQKKIEKEVKKAVEKYRQKEEAWQYSEITLTLFAIAFFAAFAVRPAAITISGLVGKIKEKEEIALKMRGKINALIEAQEKYALVQSKIALIDSFLPPDFAISQGLAQVVGNASENQISLRGISLSEVDLIERQSKRKTSGGSKASKETNLGGLKFNFSGGGDYSKIRDFLTAFGNSRRWVEFEQYQISKGEEEELSSSGKELNLNLSGKLNYWSAGTSPTLEK